MEQDSRMHLRQFTRLSDKQPTCYACRKQRVLKIAAHKGSVCRPNYVIYKM